MGRVYLGVHEARYAAVEQLLPSVVAENNQTYGAASHGGCSGSATYWTAQSVSGGFRLVNQQSGGCLSANMLGQAVFVNTCDGSTSQIWRNGSDGSLGGCLDLALTMAGVDATTCAGEASQRWSPL
ncbi:ricin-type beta-trefoil lectin domain protein [Streptomyces sp. NPDC006458]|uniref:ricin-type beta-trefoil lectin domain protein n=1 Tax=Streptomyces sp. NPDC006458 TaxID=3154302 RepID=UPI0033AE0880